MKIVLHSMAELFELAALVHCAQSKTGLSAPDIERGLQVEVAWPDDIAKPTDPYADMAGAAYGHDLHPEGYRPTEAVGQVPVYGDWSKTEDLPTSASADKAVAEMSVALRDMDTGPTKFVITDESADPEELDSTGRRWDEEIDSAAKTKTKAGAWTRSRRRDLTDERYNERAAELIAEAQARNQDEPVATETHALPGMKQADFDGINVEPEAEAAVAKPAVDLAALIEASADASLELSGSMGDLMAASRTFIEAHGVQAMNELRAAVAPDPNNPAVGLSVGSLTPAQRALVQACIQNYPT